ncbi:hypothetical protein [Spirulina sp. 06S082]|uniref:hypothetical protein n=1 Tax=Spirulina sp. 06S082 TaxID=3110248 RepID=UPI002B207315|nr:hypothetical protein [Spirulina sp. 06S082]MEA5467942.1 hypothetical protein [Spirulina sp. 06S082]
MSQNAANNGARPKNSQDKGETVTVKEAPANKAEDKKSAEDTPGIQVYQKSFPLPQNRPIEPSHLNIVGTYNAMGERPVTSSGLEISSSIVISGNRPIAKSILDISETYKVMGNRPVASNDFEDIATLIGYLD